MASGPEISGGVGQYGLPFGEGKYLFSVVKEEVDTTRIETPPIPEDLPEPDFTERNLVVLEHRYLLRDKEGKIIETPKELLWRVASNIATADLFYGEDPAEARRKFYLLMANKEFYANSPTMMNAGTELQQLSACFVIPIEDNMESINEARDQTTWIHKTGGGTGFNFSKLRPKGSPLSSGGFSSGPISFMEHFFNATTEAIKQGGKRRGANMGALDVTHPDIEEFIDLKTTEGRLVNFNISVLASDEFMRLAQEGKDYFLVDPRTGEKQKRSAKEIFEKIIGNAHAHGDPGIIFIDRINQDNPTPNLGRIETTNPCGEQPLLPYESCNLGSINLARMVKNKEIDWEKLERVTKTAVHFLDNVIDMNQLPHPKIEEATRRTRKIGLGVMGFADMLIELGIRYDSDEAIRIAEEAMKFIRDTGHEASEELARKRGPFSAYKESIYAQQGQLMRNATVTTIAPTGSIAEIAGCSSGIEPLYAPRIFRIDDVTPEGRWIIYPHFEDLIKKFNLNDEAKKKIEELGSVESIEEIPAEWRAVLRFALEISPEWHVRIQAAFQKFTNNAVSKTINLPKEASVDEVRKAYLLAWELGCKGITVYRDESKKRQVLSVREKKEEVVFERRPRPRPEITRGATKKIAMGCGQTIYLTMNEDEIGLCETFVQMGKSGGCLASQNEAIGRLISLALRSGIEIKAIVKQLKGIRCPAPTWVEEGQILSCGDAIGRAIAKYSGLSEEKLPETRLNVEMPPFESKEFSKKNDFGNCPECPDCGALVEFSEGCLRCPLCGYSQCN